MVTCCFLPFSKILPLVCKFDICVVHIANSGPSLLLVINHECARLCECCNAGHNVCKTMRIDTTAGKPNTERQFTQKHKYREGAGIRDKNSPPNDKIDIEEKILFDVQRSPALH